MSHGRIGEAGLDFTVSKYNDSMDKLEVAARRFFGRGVVTGLILSDEGDLNLGVSAGVIHALTTEIVPDDLLLELPDDETNYIWINAETQALVLTTTSADPGGELVPLGKVTTLVGAIDEITPEGRVETMRYEDLRTLKIGTGDLLVLDHLAGRVGVGVEPTTTFEVSGGAKLSGGIEAEGGLKAPYVELPEQIADPDEVIGSTMLFAKEVGGLLETHIRQGDGTTRQLTTGGGLLNLTEAVDASEVVPEDTGPLALTAAMSGKVFTDEGGGAEVEFQLPTAVAGLLYHFCVLGDGISVLAAAGDFIRIGSTITGSGGNIQATVVGSYVSVRAVSDSVWVAYGAMGDADWVV